MQNATKISDQATIGAQPNEVDIKQLAQDGFKTVVNFRPAGEQDQPFSPDIEGQRVRAAGMQYLHIPVTTSAISSELVDQFRHRYAELPKPVYAHCKGGTRAGAMVMMQTAVEQGLSGEQTLQQADELGVHCKNEDLRTFIKTYVDNHRSTQ